MFANPIRSQGAFEALIEAALKSDSVGSFGKLHVITVAQADDHPQWRKLFPKIRAITERILEARLSGDNVFMPVGPGQYLLLFPSLNETEGMVRATALAREIKQRLFGETGSDTQVSAQTMSLARLKSRAAPPSVAVLDEILESPPPQNGIHLDAIYQPVWDARRERISGCRETIRRQFGAHEIFGPAVLFGGDEDPMAVEVNTVLRDAAAASARTESLLFVLQIVNTLVVQDIDGIRAWAADLARQHPGELVIELAGGIGNLPRTRLREVVQAIRAGGPQVAAQTVPDMELACQLFDCGVRYLCVNQEQVRFAGLSPSATLALFTVIAHEVRDIGLQLCLWSTTTSQEIKRCIPLGFRYFSGAAVGQNAKAPPHPHALKSAQVFA